MRSLHPSFHSVPILLTGFMRPPASRLSPDEEEHAQQPQRDTAGEYRELQEGFKVKGEVRKHQKVQRVAKSVKARQAGDKARPSRPNAERSNSEKKVLSK